MNIARYLVQGVDVWLNTPRRPLEASGTSGMKVTFNGGLNLSVLDGWWCEGYNGENGWAIGKGEVYDDPAYQDEVEGRALYRLLEDEVIPLFYDQGNDGLPRHWIDMMRNSFRTLCPVFNTHRMVKEYAEKLYFPAYAMWKELSPDGYSGARTLSAWEKKLYAVWHKVRVGLVTMDTPGEITIGDTFDVGVPVYLGDLEPEDVTVEIYYGPLNGDGKLREGKILEISCLKRNGDGNYLYKGTLPCHESGSNGFAARVVPNLGRMKKRFTPGLVSWG